MRLDPAEVAKLACLAESRGGKALAMAPPEAGPVPASPGIGHPALDPSNFPRITEIRSGAPDLAPGRHEFTVEGFRPPTLNRLMRGRIAERIRLGKEAREAIRAAFLGSRIPLAWTPRRVSLEITLGPRQRACDVDSPWKATLDGLEHAGAIVNDSARWCRLGSLAFRRGEQASTTVILEDMEEPLS